MIPTDAVHSIDVRFDGGMAAPSTRTKRQRVLRRGRLGGMALGRSLTDMAHPATTDRALTWSPICQPQPDQ